MREIQTPVRTGREAPRTPKEVARNRSQQRLDELQGNKQLSDHLLTVKASAETEIDRMMHDLQVMDERRASLVASMNDRRCFVEQIEVMLGALDPHKHRPETD